MIIILIIDKIQLKLPLPTQCVIIKQTGVLLQHTPVCFCVLFQHTTFYSTGEVGHKASGYGLKHSGYGEIDIRLDTEEELKLYKMALRDSLGMIQSPDVVQRGQ